ncbi:MAG TPA: hypothetical protein VIP57_02245 [Candidatus Dormibacteraeota bacterium]
MPMLRVHNFSVSIDGYAAGPDQDIDNPLGVDGLRLHEWVFQTRAWNRRQRTAGGTEALMRNFILLGDGERLWDHLGGISSNYECVELVSSPAVVHARFARRS